MIQIKTDCGEMKLFYIVFCVVPLLSAVFAGNVSRIADRDIITTIESEYIFDPVIDFNSIDVTCRNGIVTLQGEVDNISAKERAEKIPAALVGVRAIVNLIGVEDSMITDEKLKQAVNRAFQRDPATESYEINVSVKDGRVTLGGKVQSWQEKRLASSVTKGVTGVRDVENVIRVVHSPKRSDYEIENDIKRRMANDVLVDDILVNVKVKKGNVFLSGKVGSLAEKNRAILDAYVAGVKNVSYKKLKIDWLARNKLVRKKFHTDKSDEEIRKALKTAFMYDPRVFGFNQEIRVENSTVILHGIVDNISAKYAATDDARSIAGVLRVKNHLKVRPRSSLKNDTLEKEITAALSIDPFIDRFNVEVDVSAGIVTLNGMVNTAFERKRAEHIVRNINGVVDIRNNIISRNKWEWKSDWEIEADIRDQLFWDVYINDDDISIQAHQGVVTLTGTVDNLMQWHIAEQNAFEGGAKEVINNLVIRTDTTPVAER